MTWRARIGILVPPGNPNLEPELGAVVPEGVSLHFTRMSASGETGRFEGLEERTRQQVAGLDAATALLALVKPAAIVLAHTATSATLGRAAEAELVARMEAKHGCRFTTAFGSVLEAFRHLGVTRIAYGTPYSAAMTASGRALLEEHGVTVVNDLALPGVANIYDLTPADAYRLGRAVDRPEAEAVMLSGVGMPTLPALAALEADLGKPVVSATAASLWHALRCAGVRASIGGHGRLLASP